MKSQTAPVDRLIEMCKVLILTYHYVREILPKYSGIHPILADDFHRQLSSLCANYDILTPEQYLMYLEGKISLERDSILITFDDGLKEQAHLAADILDSLNLKAMFFVTTAPILDQRAPFVLKTHFVRSEVGEDRFCDLFFKRISVQYKYALTDPELRRRASLMHVHDNLKTAVLKYLINFELPLEVIDRLSTELLEEVGFEEAEFCDKFFMSPNDIATLDSDQHMIGSHTHMHYPLARLGFEEGVSAISKNIITLSNYVQGDISSISYPYGRAEAIPKNIGEIVVTAGLRYGFTLNSGWSEKKQDNFLIPRITPNELDRYAI